MAIRSAGPNLVCTWPSRAKPQFLCPSLLLGAAGGIAGVLLGALVINTATGARHYLWLMNSSEANTRCDELNAAADAGSGVRWMARQASPGDWEVIRVQVPGLARKRPTSGKWEPRKTAPVPGPEAQPYGPDLDEAFGPAPQPGAWEPPTPQAAPHSRPWAPPPPAAPQTPPSAPLAPRVKPPPPSFAPPPMSSEEGHSWQAQSGIPPASPVPDDLGTLKRNYGALPPLSPHSAQLPQPKPPPAPAPPPPAAPPPAAAGQPPPWASLPQHDTDPPPTAPTMNPNWLKRLKREE